MIQTISNSITEMAGKHNWIDQNNVVFGYSDYQQCCEEFGWGVYDPKTKQLVADDLDGMMFHFDFAKGAREPNFSYKFPDGDEWGDTINVVHVDIVSDDDESRRYVFECFCKHNGYYYHDFSFEKVGKAEKVHRELSKVLKQLSEFPERMEGFNEKGELSVLYMSRLVAKLEKILLLDGTPVSDKAREENDEIEGMTIAEMFAEPSAEEFGKVNVKVERKEEDEDKAKAKGEVEENVTTEEKTVMLTLDTMIEKLKEEGSKPGVKAGICYEKVCEWLEELRDRRNTNAGEMYSTLRWVQERMTSRVLGKISAWSDQDILDRVCAAFGKPGRLCDICGTEEMKDLLMEGIDKHLDALKETEKEIVKIIGRAMVDMFAGIPNTK